MAYLRMLRLFEILQDSPCGNHTIHQMIHTKAFQVLHIKVAQQFLLRSLFRKHPVVELESKVFCTKVTFEFPQELLHIILCALTCQKLTSRDIKESHTKRTFTKMHSCEEVVFLIVQHIITQGDTRCHQFGNASFDELFREFGVFELIADSHTLSCSDQFGQIGIEGMMGKARHLVALHTCTIVTMGEGDT